jgi:hypothetical protein
MTSHEERRIFLDVKDAAPVVADLEGGRGLFVPTRLPLALNTLFLLAVRLRGTQRSIELPCVVIGRRVPRGGSLLSAGVIARLADPEDPMFALLREVTAGRVVDLEARIQEQTRVPARAVFATTSDALDELVALRDGPAHLPLDRAVQRNDRLALTVLSDEDGVLATPHVVVRSIHVQDGRRACVASLLEGQERVLDQALTRLRNKLARA